MDWQGHCRQIYLRSSSTCAYARLGRFGGVWAYDERVTGSDAGDAQSRHRAAFEAAVAEIRAMPDALAAFEAAGLLVRTETEFRGAAARLRAEQARRIWEASDGRMSLSELGASLGVGKQRAGELLKNAGAGVGADSPEVPEPRPVVAAVVVSARGVLIARRNDGKPPWTFPAGEVEPGEKPADAAVREVKEETGLLVRQGRIIGRRVHPASGRTMIYMSATPTHGTSIFVGDEDELSAVLWASLSDADRLLPSMFGPVREYLARELAVRAEPAEEE